MTYLNFNTLRKVFFKTSLCLFLFSFGHVFIANSQVSSYTLQSKDLTIDGRGFITACSCNFANKRIIIPASINGRQIKGIVDGDFTARGVFENEGLISVSFPADSKLTTIGELAFANNNLTSVDFPDGLTTIEDWAFNGNFLTTIDLPAGLTTIGELAFANNSLTSIDFPEGLTTIGDWTFRNNRLTSVTFSAGLTTIGRYAFYQNMLTSVTFSAGLTTIGDNAFYGNNLTSLDFPAGLTTIGKDAFYQNMLTYVTFSDGLTTIGDKAFLNNNLTSVDFPDGLTTIGDEAFSNNSLTSIDFPASVIQIGSSAFSSNQLNSVSFSEVSNINVIGSGAFAGSTILSPIQFPSHSSDDFVEYRDSQESQFRSGDYFSDFSLGYYTYIPYELTANELTVNSKGVITNCRCDNLPSKTIIIPTQINGEKIIGIASAVFSSKGLISVSFPEDSKLTTMGDEAFSNNNLTSITIPNGVTKIGTSAFFNNNLTSIAIPNGVTKIGTSTFLSNNLITVDLPDGLTSIGVFAFKNNNLTSISIPNGVTTISSGAFSKNDLTTVDLSDGLISIELSAFAYNKLTSIVLPSSIAFIEAWAFSFNQLMSVTFGENSNIQYLTKAFDGNPNLSPIKFPSHISDDFEEYIDGAGVSYSPGNYFSDFSLGFYASISPYELTAKELTVSEGGIITNCECDNLPSKSIIIPTQIEGQPIKGIRSSYHNYRGGVFSNIGLISVSFPADSKLTTIGGSAFSLNNLIFVDFFDGLTTIRTSAFYHNLLTSVNLPSSLVEIGRYSFISNDLTSVTFPENSKLQNISYGAFMNNSLMSVEFPSSLVGIAESAFFGNNLTDVTFPEDSELKFIAEKAFWYNNNLTSITLPLKKEEGMRYYWTKAIWDEEIDPIITDFVHDYRRESIVEQDIEKVTLTATVHGNKGGSISPDDGSFIVDKLNPPQTQIVTATASTGYRFEKWIIDGVVISDLTTTVILDSDKTAIAYFVEQDIEKVTLTATVHGNKGGSISPDDGSFIVDKLNPPQTQIVTATASTGYRFEKWIIDGVVISDLTTTVILDSDKTAIAYFVEQDIEKVTLTATVHGNKGGSISPDDGSFIVDKLNPPQTQIVTATSSTGYRFEKWIIDGVVISDSTTTVILDSDKTAIAYFVEQDIEKVTLTATVHGNKGGSVSPDDGSFIVDKLNPPQTQIVTATSSTGYRFEKWIIDGVVISDSTTTVILDSDKTAIAYFVEQDIEKVTLTATVHGNKGGSVSPDDGSFIVDKLNPPQTQIVTATSSTGYRFEKWIIDGVVISDSTTTVILDSDKTAIAYFVEQDIEKVTLTATIHGNKGGSVSPDDGSFIVDKLNPPQTQIVTATSSTGYRFEKWIIDGVVISDSTTTVILDSDKTAIAYFVEQDIEKVTLTATVHGNKGGSVSPDDGSFIVDKLNPPQTQIVTATSSTGYRFEKWIIDGVVISDSTTTVILDSNKTVVAYFVEEQQITPKPPHKTKKHIISFYPNPVLSVLTVVADIGDQILLLSPVRGIVYASQPLADQYHQIDLSSLPTGFYLLQISNPNSDTITERVVKISGG